MGERPPAVSVGLNANGRPICGHSRLGGYAGKEPDSWWCWFCALHAPAPTPEPPE